LKQVCVQLPTPADDVALPAFAAARRAAAPLLLTAGRAAIDRCHLVAGPTAANLLRAAGEWDRDRRMSDSGIDRSSAYYAGSAN